VRTQKRSTHRTPLGGLVKAEFRVEATPCATVVPMLAGTVRIAIAGAGQHRTTTWVSAGRGRTQRHSHLPLWKRLAS
jgi:hypothetical protein